MTEVPRKGLGIWVFTIHGITVLLEETSYKKAQENYSVLIKVGKQRALQLPMPDTFEFVIPNSLGMPYFY